MTAKKSGERGNQAEYARHRGVSKVAVHKALKAGRITLEADGKIDFAKADAAWSENSSPRRTALADLEPKKPAATPARSKPAPARAPRTISAPPSVEELPSLEGVEPGDDLPMMGGDMTIEDGQTPSLQKSRTWREYHLARLARLKADEAEGKLINAGAARLAQFNLARKARDMLMSIADRLAPVLAGVSDPFEIHTLLNDEHRRICNEIAAARSH